MPSPIGPREDASTRKPTRKKRKKIGIKYRRQKDFKGRGKGAYIHTYIHTYINLYIIEYHIQSSLVSN